MPIPKPRGLINTTSYNCYFNAAIQVLIRNKPINDYLNTKRDKTNKLIDVLAHYTFTDDTLPDKIEDLHIFGHGQQDASEFLVKCLLYEPIITSFCDIFTFYTIEQRTNRKSALHENPHLEFVVFQSLTKSTIHKLIHQTFNHKQFNETTNLFITTNITIHPSVLPSLLIITPQYTDVPIHPAFTFNSDILDITPFVSNPSERIQYRLRSIIIRSPSLNQNNAHYVCAIRDMNNDWYLYNDNNVTKIYNIQRSIDNVFIVKTLVYERIDHSLIQQIQRNLLAPIRARHNIDVNPVPKSNLITILTLLDF